MWVCPQPGVTPASSQVASRCVWERGAGKVQKLEEGRSNSCWRVREFSEEEWTLAEVWKEAQEEGSEWGGEDAVHSGPAGGSTFRKLRSWHLAPSLHGK